MRKSRMDIEILKFIYLFIYSITYKKPKKVKYIRKK